MYWGKGLIVGTVVFVLGLTLAGPAKASPTPQSGVCPILGTLTDSTCNVQIIAGPGGTFTTIQGNNSSPYDGIEDTMVGVVNNSGNPLLQLALAGSSGGYPLFGFDGDGLQTYGGAGGAPDNTGYGGQTSLGQNTWFVNISLDQTSGTAVFGNSGIPDGGWAYFSLEGPPSLDISPHTSVPEPSVLGMFGLGALLIGLFAGLRRRVR